MAKTSNNASNWKLEGDYFEGCNCASICPCIFKLDSTEGECKVVVAWHIERGHFGNGDINLDNLMWSMPFMLLEICLLDQNGS